MLARRGALPHHHPRHRLFPFGPVDLNPRSPTWGYLTSTPKPGWANTDLAGPLRRTPATSVT
ncbi:MAG: hypothetical protein RMK99_06465 [Anaerolineales bacterium]|nr:hypothetical protein [Anaerolineales bacterium]